MKVLDGRNQERENEFVKVNEEGGGMGGTKGGIEVLGWVLEKDTCI